MLSYSGATLVCPSADAPSLNKPLLSKSDAVEILMTSQELILFVARAALESRRGTSILTA